jgi:protein SCO1/2
MKRFISYTSSRKGSIIALVAIALGIALVIIAMVPIAGTAYADKANYLPDITLTNQHSQQVSLASLRGKPVLVGFIHTMCKGVCQMMTANMKSVASALPSKSAADLTMLVVTTDPADDQPPQLREYAKSQSLVGNQWILVTGPKGSIKRVMKLFGVKHEDSDDAMMHVMKLFLVAPGGTLAHVYPGMKVSPQAIASDIEGLSSP